MRMIFCSVFVLTLISITSNAQNLENIANAFKAGDVSSLEKHFDGDVEITIQNGGTWVSKNQAFSVLQIFFSTHEPRQFKIIHQGWSELGAKYIIGKLTTTYGTYQTYLYGKVDNGILVFDEIRFDKQ